LIYHQYNDSIIPIKVLVEWRLNTRISIGQRYVYLRLPKLNSKKSVDQQIQWGKKWLNTQLVRNPQIAYKFLVKTYKTGDLIKVNGKEFILDIVKQTRKTSTAKVVDERIMIIVANHLNALSYSKTIKQLLSRAVSQYFIVEINKRIQNINLLYFNYELNQVKIKYNKSNWGSCSAKKNINISSRLLFAPPKVQDYVFIHELTHLREMNHSPEFWKKVKSIVPDYKQKEKWLKQNGHFCDF